MKYLFIIFCLLFIVSCQEKMSDDKISNADTTADIPVIDTDATADIPVVDTDATADIPVVDIPVYSKAVYGKSEYREIK